MFQIRLHGRGGQGVVTAAEMLSLAAFMEGHFAQAFPSFGSERTGAPVTAFARFSDHEIRLHEPIEEPDVVLVQDRTLIDSVDVFSGLNPEGYVLVNSASSPEEIGPGEAAPRGTREDGSGDGSRAEVHRPPAAGRRHAGGLCRDDGHAEAGKHQLGLRSEILR